jgi:hypothetical protein
MADSVTAAQEAFDRLVAAAGTADGSIHPAATVTSDAVRLAAAFGLQFIPPTDSQAPIYVGVDEQLHRPGLGAVVVVGADHEGRVWIQDALDG